MHRVLIVDDYPDAADIACVFLRLLGHEARTASSGREALEQARHFAPDIVILDIGLPDLSGFQVAQQLRAELGRTVYLAAMTGWGQPTDRMRAIAAGFDEHVLKPADADKLCAIIRRAEAAGPART